MKELSLNQQAELKNLEYQLKHMSREQLETFCLGLACNFMNHQNAVRQVFQEKLIGEAGDPGF